MSDDAVSKPFKFVTCYDPRFPNQNQTKHCFQKYVDYQKCVLAKGEDFAPCTQFKISYRTLCTPERTNHWDELRENGNFPIKLDE